MRVIAEMYGDLRSAKARWEVLLSALWLFAAALRISSGDYFMALLELLLAITLLQVAALRVLRYYDARLARTP